MSDIHRSSWGRQVRRYRVREAGLSNRALICNIKTSPNVILLAQSRLFPLKRTGHVEKYPKDVHVSTGRPIATQRKRPLAGETGGVQLPPHASSNRFLVECGFDLGCIDNATPIETIDCYAFSVFVSNSETTQNDEARPLISMSTIIRSGLLFIIRLRFGPIIVGKANAP